MSIVAVFVEASKPNRHCAKEPISGRDWFFYTLRDAEIGRGLDTLEQTYGSGIPFRRSQRTSASNPGWGIDLHKRAVIEYIL